MNQEMKELKEELEEKLSRHNDKVRAGGKEPAGSSSELLPVPLKQKITEALDIEKRNDMIVIRGIQESHKGYPGNFLFQWYSRKVRI